MKVPHVVDLDLKKRVGNLVAQYHRTILDLAEHHHGSFEQMTQHLITAAIAQRYAGQAAASEASAPFFPEGDEL